MQEGATSSEGGLIVKRKKIRKKERAGPRLR